MIATLLILIAQISFAQDDVSSDNNAPAANVTEKKESRRSRRKDPVDPYKKSKLSSDRSEALADKRIINLALGVDKIVDIDFELASPPERGIQIGNTNLVMTIPVKIGDKNQLVIKPIAVGETNITIRDQDGIPRLIIDTNVAPVDLEKLASDLRDNLLKEVEGLEYKIIGGKLHIDGEILTTLDYGRIADVLSEKRFVDNTVNHTSMSPISLRELAKRIQADVQVVAPTVTTRLLNGKILLEGTVDDPGKIDAAMKRARMFIPEAKPADPASKDPTGNRVENPPELVQNLIAYVPQPKKRDRKLVRLTVHFVELNKDYRKVFGFKWQPGFTADPSISLGTTATGGVNSTSAGQSGFSFAATLSALFPALKSMQDAGYGRIIRSATAVAQLFNSDDDPSVIDREGKIEITDKQEFPSTTIGQNGAIAAGAKTPVGFTMRVVPTLLSEGNINLSLGLEHVAKIGDGPGGQPITAVQNVNTRVYLKSGEVAAVASSDNSDQTTGYNREDPNPGGFAPSPTGAQTSPLFTMNRTKSFIKKKTQFVVFVSPQIIENASDGTADLKKNFRIRSN